MFFPLSPFALSLNLIVSEEDLKLKDEVLKLMKIWEEDEWDEMVDSPRIFGLMGQEVVYFCVS